ncbi:MAG TPA: phosphoribosylformylglycinamidine cyclo-ligase [Spirochaetes bacterium]|nr:phosphoribosylformylglycinamidine cyclo-ligase [Spirochaetota bacterium]
MGLTYRDSGVDIEKGDHFVRVIKEKLSGSEKRNIGLFGGMFELNPGEYKNPVLVSGTDGVGTKLLLAKVAGKYGTIGIDLVAMCVNDVITSGAKPLFFLDYMACGELEVKKASEVIDGIIEGCRLSGCVLLGGETAEMPGMYKKGDYEIAGFCVGVVEKKEIINGKSIAGGDILVGLRSSGIHSNGLSLARKALFEKKKYRYSAVHPLLARTLIEELLIPTRIYTDPVCEIVKKVTVKGIAHITGGGIPGNIIRLLPPGFGPKIYWEKISPPPVFHIIEDAGGIEKDEMRKTFNMGIGIVFITDWRNKERLVSLLKEKGEEPLIIGEIIPAV